MRRVAAIGKEMSLDATFGVGGDSVQLQRRSIVVLSALNEHCGANDVLQKVLDGPVAKLRMKPNVGPAEEQLSRIAVMVNQLLLENRICPEPRAHSRYAVERNLLDKHVRRLKQQTRARLWVLTGIDQCY